MKKFNLVILVADLVYNSVVGVNASNYASNHNRKATLELPYATEKEKEILENNYANGELPLAETNEEKPVKVISKTSDVGSEKIELYSDGSSYSRRITGGTCSSGSGYTSCSGRLVKTSYPTYGVDFRADYTLVNGGNDYIRKVYDPVARRWASQQSFDLVYKAENSSRKAYAQLNYRVNHPGVMPDVYRGLRLTVGGNKAVDTYIYL